MVSGFVYCHAQLKARNLQPLCSPEDAEDFMKQTAYLGRENGT